jgi:hypothetical protein
MIPGYDLKEEDKETAVVFKPLLRRRSRSTSGSIQVHRKSQHLIGNVRG